ncbi:hypothetical protein EDC65_4277 [Stella humosa]|uniref:Uncharacterized protein n=1 Tax=Stella humosa TaxID=94 RepID=A0A3N1KZ86_9PROT|nr:hypothetical protein EDC65_4277 [Stella humosa]
MEPRYPALIEAGHTAAFVEEDGLTASVHFFDPRSSEPLAIVHLPRRQLEMLRDHIDEALRAARR